MGVFEAVKKRCAKCISSRPGDKDNPLGCAVAINQWGSSGSIMHSDHILFRLCPASLPVFFSSQFLSSLSCPCPGSVLSLFCLFLPSCVFLVSIPLILSRLSCLCSLIFYHWYFLPLCFVFWYIFIFYLDFIILACRFVILHQVSDI